MDRGVEVLALKVSLFEFEMTHGTSQELVLERCLWGDCVRVGSMAVEDAGAGALIALAAAATCGRDLLA